jgi:transcriptional regulator with XRE-family HTH domain
VNGVFGRKLRDLRRERDLLQLQVGDLLGLSRVTIANIESGKQNVQLHQIFSLASVLNVQVDRLIPSPTELELGERFMGRVRSDLLAPSDILCLEFAHGRLTEFAGGHRRGQGGRLRIVCSSCYASIMFLNRLFPLMLSPELRA